MQDLTAINQRSLGDSHCVDENYEEAIAAFARTWVLRDTRNTPSGSDLVRTDPRFYQLSR
jgi:hypothetical protein